MGELWLSTDCLVAGRRVKTKAGRNLLFLVRYPLLLGRSWQKCSSQRRSQLSARAAPGHRFSPQMVTEGALPSFAGPGVLGPPLPQYWTHGQCKACSQVAVVLGMSRAFTREKGSGLPERSAAEGTEWGV